MVESDGLLNRCRLTPYLGFESRSLRLNLRAVFPLALLMGLAVSPVWAQGGYEYQSPTEYYLSARRLYPPVPNLTTRLLAQTPTRYQGKTLELTGRCTGIVKQGTGALLLLQSPRDGSLSLELDVVPTWLQPGGQLRVLVVAMGAPEGEIVLGMPDMQVVAVASESDIAAEEYAWARDAGTRARREALREAALRANRARLSASGSSVKRSKLPLPSRGGARSALTSNALAAYPAYKEFISRWNTRLTDAEAGAMASSILLYSEKYDVDPRLVCALIIAESDFRPGITSRSGAMGLGQIMPESAREIGLTNPYDPVQSIAGATYLLRGRLDKYSGGKSREDLEMRHIILALASYNAGMGAVKKYGGVPPYRETQNYVRKIERIYRQLCAGDAESTAGGGNATR